MTMDLVLTSLIGTPLAAGLLSLTMKSRRAMQWLQCSHAAVLLGTMSVVVTSVGGGAELTVGNFLRRTP